MSHTSLSQIRSKLQQPFSQGCRSDAHSVSALPELVLLTIRLDIRSFWPGFSSVKLNLTDLMLNLGLG